MYTKPKDVKYTDMAIFIDNNVYREDLSEDDKNKIFEYLYHIINMLAHQGRYFNTNPEYVDFALYGASRMFMRYLNPKQFRYNSEGVPKQKKIKSCLNFCKKVLVFYRIDYQQENYSQTLSKDAWDYAPEQHLSTILNDSVNELALAEFKIYLGSISSSVKHFLRHIPYSKDPIVWNNIYISCLLTFLNSITLRAREISYVKNLKAIGDTKVKAAQRLLDDWADNCVVLYHLDESMSDYIKVLVNELKHYLAVDLSSMLHTDIGCNSNMDLLALSEINDNNYYEENKWEDKLTAL